MLLALSTHIALPRKICESRVNLLLTWVERGVWLALGGVVGRYAA